MRNYTLILVILVFSLLLLFQSIAFCDIFTQPLLQKMGESGSEDFISVFVMMQEQSNQKHLLRLVKGMEMAKRKKFITKFLKNLRDNSQEPILAYLKEKEQEGKVKDLRSLWIVNAISFNATIDVLYGLAKFSNIHYIDLEEMKKMINDPIILPISQPLYGPENILWNIYRVRANVCWSLYTGKNIVVGVIDTGVRYTHYDLVDHIWKNSDEIPLNGIDDDGNGYIDDYYGYVFWPGYPQPWNPRDDNGHGTHCAGTIAGDGTCGINTGVAIDAQIMSLKVLNAAGSGQASYVLEAMQYGTDNGANILSMSIGWDCTQGTVPGPWRVACNNVLSAGLIISASAGNLGHLQGKCPIPLNIIIPGGVPPPWMHPDQTLTGGLSSVITVGATDENDEVAFFSSRGPYSWGDVEPWYDYPYDPEMGLLDPDICAPGVNIISLESSTDNEYTDPWSGTSMATPHVAGAIAIILDKENLAPEFIDYCIEMSAVDKDPPGKDNEYGSGRLDCYEAWQRTDPPYPPAFLYANSNSWHNIDLDWVDVPAEDGYKIFRSSGGSFAEIAESPTGPDVTHIIDEGIPQPSYIYYYYVTAFNIWGEPSYHSPVAEETTLIKEDQKITGIIFVPPMRTNVKWTFSYGVYKLDRIVWNKAGPMQTEPTWQDLSFYKLEENNLLSPWYDLTLPPEGWWVAYQANFYTEYGHPSHTYSTTMKIAKRPGPDPPIAATADTFATAYSNSRKIIVDSNDRMHITYTSNDTVYYVYSDDGEIFSTPVSVGNGRYPGIALDENEYPHICWVREDIEYEGYILYHSKLTQSGWTTPDELLNGSATEVTPPSFDIDKDDNVASLTWADFPIGEEKWIFYKGQFSLLDTTPQVIPIPYDSAVQMTPESPNYICDQTGMVDGYLLWDKNGDVYTAIEANGVVQNITNISNSLNLSIHPNLSIFGDSLYAVWQENYPFGNKIFFTKRSTGLNNNWETSVELTDFPDSVEYPVCYGPYVIASAKTLEGNYDIYGLRTVEFGDISYIYQITGTKSKSEFPAICYTQHFPEGKLYALWTEDTTMIRGEPAIGPVKCKIEAMVQPIPKIAANLGTPNVSPYTVQREGYIIFGNLAFKSVDYHPQELIYRFTGLKPSESYKLKLIFYYEKEDRSPSLLLRVKAGKQIIGGVNIEPDEPRYFEKWIPSSTYQSGTLDITIEKWIGDYDFAVCSEIFLYEYEKNNGSEGAQLAENLEDFPQKMKFIAPRPNPFMGFTKIGFVIPQKEEVTLKIYDVSGRLCKTFVDKKLNAGTYYYNWDGKGEDAKRSVCGVYFTVLNVGEKRLVRKIVKIK